MTQKACCILICNCGNSLYDHGEARGALATHIPLSRGGGEVWGQGVGDGGGRVLGRVVGGGQRGLGRGGVRGRVGKWADGVVGLGEEPQQCNLSEISRGRSEDSQESPSSGQNPTLGVKQEGREG